MSESLVQNNTILSVDLIALIFKSDFAVHFSVKASLYAKQKKKSVENSFLQCALSVAVFCTHTLMSNTSILYLYYLYKCIPCHVLRLCSDFLKFGPVSRAAHDPAPHVSALINSACGGGAERFGAVLSSAALHE